MSHSSFWQHQQGHEPTTFSRSRTPRQAIWAHLQRANASKGNQIRGAKQSSWVYSKPTEGALKGSENICTIPFIVRETYDFPTVATNTLAEGSFSQSPCYQGLNFCSPPKSDTLFAKQASNWSFLRVVTKAHVQPRSSLTHALLLTQELKVQAQPQYWMEAELAKLTACWACMVLLRTMQCKACHTLLTVGEKVEWNLYQIQ